MDRSLQCRGHFITAHPIFNFTHPAPNPSNSLTFLNLGRRIGGRAHSRHEPIPIQSVLQLGGY